MSQLWCFGKVAIHILKNDTLLRPFHSLPYLISFETTEASSFVMCFLMIGILALYNTVRQSLQHNTPFLTVSLNIQPICALIPLDISSEDIQCHNNTTTTYRQHALRSQPFSARSA